jgi:type 1 glutamine amidotransferase
MKRITLVALTAALGCTGTLNASEDARTLSLDAQGPDAPRPDAALPDAPGLDAPFDDAAMEALDAYAAPDAEPMGTDIICQPWPMGADAYDQSVVPLEVEPLRGSARKIVLVAGRSSMHAEGQHEFFASMGILAHLLCQIPGVVPVMVRDGWPMRESVFDGAAAIVFYADGGASHPLADAAHQAVLQRHIDAGVGFVALHYAVEPSAESAPTFRAWLGGNYETGTSCNPYWRANYESFGGHPVLRGITPFSIDDEWYFNLRWADGAGPTNLLQATPPESARITPDAQSHPGRIETTAWAYERPAVGFTGGHWYGNWLDSPETPSAPMQRRVVLNGILWTAGVEVPGGGAEVAYEASLGGLWRDRR